MKIQIYNKEICNLRHCSFLSAGMKTEWRHYPEIKSEINWTVTLTLVCLIILFLLFCHLLRYFLIHSINAKKPNFIKRKEVTGRMPYRYSTCRTLTNNKCMEYTIHIRKLWLITISNEANKFLFKSQRDHYLKPYHPLFHYNIPPTETCSQKKLQKQYFTILPSLEIHFLKR